MLKIQQRDMVLSLLFYMLTQIYSGLVSAESRYQLDVPSQSLARALELFASETGCQFIYTDANVGASRSAHLAGEYTLEQGIETLLRGTGITFERVNNNTIHLFRLDDSEAVTVVPQAFSNNYSSVLEEVMVTSRKRVERLKDIPVAVSWVDGEQLSLRGTNDLQSLSTSMPGLYVAEGFLGDAIYVRGIGSGQNNLGFEQAVGQVVDGLFYARSRFSRIGFLDLERVEIMKGPQGVLFGKNTTAGVINTVTAKPGEEWETYFRINSGLEGYNGEWWETAVSGPLGETLQARLALKQDRRDGFIKNTSNRRDDPDIDDQLARLSVNWQVQDTLEILWQYQVGRLDYLGGNNQYSNCAFIPVYAGPEENCQLDYQRSAAARRLGEDVESKQTDFDTYAVSVNWELDAFQFSSLTGYAWYDYLDTQDGDRTKAERVLTEFAEEYRQFSQEFRISSLDVSGHRYILGLYFLDNRQDTDYIIHLSDLIAPHNSVSRNVFTRENGKTYALFAHWEAMLTTDWWLSVGGRYTYEKADANSVQYPSELYNRNRPLNPCPNVVEGVCYQHAIRDAFDEENFSPVVSLQWYAEAESMYYLTLSRGFKAGGFDHNLVAEQPNAGQLFQFDPETVRSYELGAKLGYWQGRGELNLALFYSRFSDLQLSGFVDSVAAINSITNAGSAVTQGLELDFRWLIGERLQLNGALAYLDSRYDNYSNAPCYTGQAVGIGACEDRNGDSSGDAQNLSGKKLQFANEWKAVVSAEYYWVFADAWQLTAYTQLSFVDDFPLQADLDPRLFQGSYLKSDARLSLSPYGGDWSIALIGRNLGNKQVSNYGDDVPLQSGNYWRSIDPPRTITLQLSLRY